MQPLIGRPATAPERGLASATNPRGVRLRIHDMKFDIDRYKSLAARLDDTGIAYQAFRYRPLSEDVLRCIRYMHDIESHTVCYLRDLLVTRAHDDPEMTAFLTCWAYEELWHGEALGRVLAAHGEPSGADRITDSGIRGGFADRVNPLIMAATSALVPQMGAIHMTWGAINEWTTQAGYARLAQRADHPVLTDLLKRIMKQEGRHIDFYASQAVERLGSSRTARRLTRTALTRLWAPVGSAEMPDEEVRHLITFLFGGEDGLAVARRIDRRIDRLPGLEGLSLIEGARQDHLDDHCEPADDAELARIAA